MKTPLYDAVKNYQPNLRLHMPGHSGNTCISPLYSCCEFDITELDFSDNLLTSSGVILESECNAANVYGSNYCLYYTTGATTAIFTAINVAKHKVSNVEILGKPHKSIINACELFGLSYKIVNCVSHDAVGIILTTPDYYGNTLDVCEIRKAHPNAFIIVDEAHGAHFAFSSLLPKNVGSEADMVVNGLHKTLPVFTGGAILRTDNKELYELAREYRAKLHSTSPSYLIMTSIDYAIGLFSEKGEAMYEKIKHKVDSLTLPCGFKRVQNNDFTRLVIEVPSETSGYAVAKEMEKQGVYFELVEDRILVCILTPYNYEKLDLLSGLNATAVRENRKDFSIYIGQVAKKDIGLYPPGKIYIKKGEVITKEIIDFLQIEDERVFGLE